MQVACEHCGSEYTMDENSITGRGVRITCPNCSHVFTVYKVQLSSQSSSQQADEMTIDIGIDLDELIDDEVDIDLDSLLSSFEHQNAPTSAVVSNPKSAQNTPASPQHTTVPAQSASDDEAKHQENVQDRASQDTVKDTIDEDIDIEIDLDIDLDIGLDLDADLADPVAVSSKPAEVVNKSTPVQNPINPIPVQTEDTTDNHEELGVEIGDEPPQITEERVDALDASSLNFQEVGIKKWQVKNAIGIVFDFSDYKTFAKSFKDGRISDNDGLSHNGVDWVPIKNIDNLEKYFCRVYLEYTYSKTKVAETPKVVKERVIQKISGMNDLASALAEAQAEVEQTEKHNSKLQQKQRKSTHNSNKRKPEQKTTSSTATNTPTTQSSSSLLINVLVAFLVLGGGWYFFVGSKDTPPVQEVKALTPTQVSTTDEMENIRKSLQDEIKSTASQLQEELPQQEEQEEPQETQYIVKIPDEVLRQQAEKNGDLTAKIAKVDYASEGNKAIQQQKWKEAESAFTKAYADKQDPAYLERKGFALYKMGKGSDAKKVLKDAIGKGMVVANKWLGYIAHEEGDESGANTYWTAYLQSNPNDAAMIRKMMEQ